MDEQHQTTGIEVEEQLLGNWELGFLAGVFAAWGIRRPGENEYRDAITLLMAQQQGPARPKRQRPELRLVPGATEDSRSALSRGPGGL